MTYLYDVLNDIRQQPRLKQIIWRDGINILVSRVYEILNAASDRESFNVGNPLCCKVQKYNHSLVNFEEVAELDLRRKIEEARSLDVDRFQDMISTVQDDQILKVLKSSAFRSRKHEHTPNRYLGCQEFSIRKP